MEKTEKMQTFIIKVLYYAIWAAIIYCILKFALPLFMPFVIAFFIAFMLKPLINKISEKTFLKRKAAAVLVLILFYLILITLIILLGAKLTTTLKDLFGYLPTFYGDTLAPAVSRIGGGFERFLGGFGPEVKDYIDTISGSLSASASALVTNVSSWAVNGLGSMAGKVPWFVVRLVITIVSSFFFVADYYKVTGFITRQFSERNKERFFVVKEYIVNVLFKFFRAYLIILSVTFLEVSAGLLIMRVPNAFVIAFITAVVDIFPVLGTGTILIPWAVYNLFTGNYFWGVGLLVLYSVITFIRQILEPRVVGGQIGLHPLLTLICMFIGARLFGFWGMLGFPITLTVIIHLNKSGEISVYKEAQPVPQVPKSVQKVQRAIEKRKSGAKKEDTTENGGED